MSRLLRRQALSIFRAALAAADPVDAVLRHAPREECAATGLNVAIESDHLAVTTMSRVLRRHPLCLFRAAPAAVSCHARCEDRAAADLHVAIESDAPAVTTMRHRLRPQALSVVRAALTAADPADTALYHARREDCCAADLHVTIESQTIMSHPLLK